MKAEDESSKEVASVTMSAIACSSNKAPSTSCTTVVLGEDQVYDGKTPQMPVAAADFKEGNSVLEPAPSDVEVQEAIYFIKEVLEPQVSESRCSSMITPCDSVTSEGKQLAPINAPEVGAAISLICNIENGPPSVKKMIVGAAKDEKLWHGFMNSESVVEFMRSNGMVSPTLEENGSVSNVKEDGDQCSEVDRNRYFKLIIDKAKEMVMEVVIKAFDGMEKVFLRHQQPPHQKTKQSCCDFKYPPEERSTCRKMRTPFLATLLINLIVLLCRIIRAMLKYRSLT